MMKRISALVNFVIVLAATTAIFHDHAGNVTGSARTDANGVTTFHDRSGFTTGRASTDMNGVTRVYDPAGRVTGSMRRR